MIRPDSAKVGTFQWGGRTIQYKFSNIGTAPEPITSLMMIASPYTNIPAHLGVDSAGCLVMDSMIDRERHARKLAESRVEQLCAQVTELNSLVEKQHNALLNVRGHKKKRKRR